VAQAAYLTMLLMPPLMTPLMTPPLMTRLYQSCSACRRTIRQRGS